MSTISASTTSTTAYKVTADTTGALVLQTGATPTTAVTISSAQVATFAQAPVLPAASIPQAALATNVAGNGPAFSYYASTSQSFSGNVFVKVTLGTSLFDTTGGMFSSSKFQPTVAGYYQVNGRICMASSGGSVRQILSVFKNGSEYCRLNDMYTATPTSGNFIFNGSGLIYLNGSTDYIELYGYFNGTGLTFWYASSNETSGMSASLVRSA